MLVELKLWTSLNDSNGLVTRADFCYVSVIV